MRRDSLQRLNRRRGVNLEMFSVAKLERMFDLEDKVTVEVSPEAHLDDCEQRLLLTRGAVAGDRGERE